MQFILAEEALYIATLTLEVNNMNDNVVLFCESVNIEERFEIGRKSIKQISVVVPVSKIGEQISFKAVDQQTEVKFLLNGKIELFFSLREKELFAVINIGYKG